MIEGRLSIKRINNIVCVLAAYVSMLGMKIDISILESERSSIVQFFDSLSGFSLTDIVMFVGLFCFYKYALSCLRDTICPRDIVCAAFPALMFACFMVLGKAVANADNLSWILSGGLQILKALIAVCGWFIFFATGIAMLFIHGGGYTDKEDVSAARQKIADCWYVRKLHEHTFVTVFVTVFIAYIPYMLISYPAIFMGDTCAQIAEGYNFKVGPSEYLRLIDENVRLNGHHPIIHTLYMHLCMVAGKYFFDSYNVGIFLLAMTQTICTIGAIAYAISVMEKAGVKTRFIFCAMAYFIFSPRIQNMMFYISKDIFQACALLVLLISMWRIQKGDVSKAVYISFTISGIFTGLLRNEGKYILIVCFAVLLIVERKSWKKLLPCITVIMLAVIMLFHVIMPAFKITQPSIREALSLPFQQTARYIRDYGDEVTQEEKNAISKVLNNYELLAEEYVPENGDFIKTNFNEEASATDLINYFKVWREMLKKHPIVYIEAVLNNYYNYFYPGDELIEVKTYEQSAIYMTYVNDALKEMGMSIYYPEWSGIFRKAYEAFREKLFGLPVLSLLQSAATYTWTLVLWIFYLLKNRKAKLLVPALPLILSLGVALLASRNGEYFRYIYGIALNLPVVISLGEIAVSS